MRKVLSVKELLHIIPILEALLKAVCPAADVEITISTEIDLLNSEDEIDEGVLQATRERAS